eukprot:scaffold7500_cov127-Isochrysis_galbana.AAC.15
MVPSRWRRQISCRRSIAHSHSLKPPSYRPLTRSEVQRDSRSSPAPRPVDSPVASISGIQDSGMTCLRSGTRPHDGHGPAASARFTSRRTAAAAHRALALPGLAATASQSQARTSSIANSGVSASSSAESSRASSKALAGGSACCSSSAEKLKENIRRGDLHVVPTCRQFAASAASLFHRSQI